MPIMSFTRDVSTTSQSSQHNIRFRRLPSAHSVGVAGQDFSIALRAVGNFHCTLRVAPYLKFGGGRRGADAHIAGREDGNEDVGVVVAPVLQRRAAVGGMDIEGRYRRAGVDTHPLGLSQGARGEPRRKERKEKEGVFHIGFRFNFSVCLLRKGRVVLRTKIKRLPKIPKQIFKNQTKIITPQF